MPWPTGIPRTLNAEQRAERARRAALARTSPDYFIAKLAAMRLTKEQRGRLAELILTGDAEDGAA
jgi:hypothetical protein